jgi:hypothetical protein
MKRLNPKNLNSRSGEDFIVASDVAKAGSNRVHAEWRGECGRMAQTRRMGMQSERMQPTNPPRFSPYHCEPSRVLRTRPTSPSVRDGHAPTLQSHEIEQELEPEVKHPAPGVADLFGADRLEETGSHIVIDLSSEILFQKFAGLFGV